MGPRLVRFPKEKLCSDAGRDNVAFFLPLFVVSGVSWHEAGSFGPITNPLSGLVCEHSRELQLDALCGPRVEFSPSNAFSTQYILIEGVVTSLYDKRPDCGTLVTR